jgi:AcrR family transcriptional regulator
MPRTPLTETQLKAGRARIVQAAVEIVGAEGLEALSMRTLANAVGLTPGALYRYFPNKDAVTEAVLGGGGELDNRILAAAKSRVSDLKAVRQALNSYAEFAFEDEARFRALFLRHHGPAGRAFHARGRRRPGTEAFVRRIQSAMDAGMIRKMDSDLALQVLWSAVHGVVVLVLTAEGFPFAARVKVVQAAIDNAMRGMAGPIKNKPATSR